MVGAFRFPLDISKFFQHENRMYVLAERRDSELLVEVATRRGLEDRLAKYIDGVLIQDMEVLEIRKGNPPTMRYLSQEQIGRIYRDHRRRLEQ